MEKIRNVLFIIVTILFVFYISFDVYNFLQPKTSVDLVRKFSNINVEKYDEYAIDLEKEDYEQIQRFINNSHSGVAQYTIIKSKRDILILETTPQIVDNRLKVTNVKKVSKEDFENLFNE